MMRDYSYAYEWDQEYCYPNSNVLINKLNIQNADALHTAEREITSLRLAAAKMQPVKGKFDLRHLQKIHAYLFGDIYGWAGKLRHVNIAKGNQFCLAMNLETYGGNLFRKLEQERYLIGSTEFIPHRLAYYFSEINVLHPFREGNGRTQRLFIEYLASAAGFCVDFSQVSTEEMMIASADSFACDYESINRMFERITTPISEEEQKENIRSFFGNRGKPLAWLREVNL